jgi:hypothetical protein
MTCKDWRAISLVLGIALAVLSLQAVRAQSADQVLCDRIAAASGDPDKPADIAGVAKIAPSGIPICF